MNILTQGERRFSLIRTDDSRPYLMGEVEYFNDVPEEEAPVDLAEPDYRTLLLGMKPNTEYHFRILAKAGNTVYRSNDYKIETGDVRNGLPDIEIFPLTDSISISPARS